MNDEGYDDGCGNGRDNGTGADTDANADIDPNAMFRVNGSQFVLELLPDGEVLIWDTNKESAFDEWVIQGMPREMRPPYPLAASLGSEQEAFDWLEEELGLERPFIPVTRIQ